MERKNEYFPVLAQLNKEIIKITSEVHQGELTIAINYTIMMTIISCIRLEQFYTFIGGARAGAFFQSNRRIMF